MLREIPKDYLDRIEDERDGSEDEDDEETVVSERLERMIVRYFRAHPPATREEAMNIVENHFMRMDEDDLVAEARRDNWNDAEEAQELMFQMTTMSPDTEWDAMAVLAQKALALDPDNADAGMLLAAQTGADLGDIEAVLRGVVARAERALGADIEEGKGALWLNALARPYLRARCMLVAVLREAECWDEAIAEAREILELNKEDEQDVSSVLLGLYLASGDTRSARAIMKAYMDEDSAVYEWAAVLEKFLSGNRGGAKKALETAMRNSPHVALYLLKPEAMTDDEPLPGTEAIMEEAIDCVQNLSYAWAAHSEALEWLNAVLVEKSKPRRRGTGKKP